VLADTLHTDRSRLRPLTPDSQATLTLRNSCRTRKDLVAHRVAMANQPRGAGFFPAAIGMFTDIDSPVSLAFLTRFDSQDAADWLSPRRFAAWLSKVGYSGKVDPQGAAPTAHQGPARPERQPRQRRGPRMRARRPRTRYPRCPTGPLCFAGRTALRKTLGRLPCR
jgi:hypothetical protein